MNLHVKCPLFLPNFNENWIFLNRVLKNTQIQILTETCLVVAKLYHADRRTDMSNLIFAFRSFANAPNKRPTICNYIDFRTRSMTRRKEKRQSINLYSSSDQYLLSQPQNTAHIYRRMGVVTARLTTERTGNIMPLSDMQSSRTLLVVRVQSSSSSYQLVSSLTCHLFTNVHSVQQKSIGLKFSKSRTGSDVRWASLTPAKVNEV